MGTQQPQKLVTTITTTTTTMTSLLAQRERTKMDILNRFPTDASILNHADSISLDEFKCLGDRTPKFAEGLFDEPTTAGGRRKRKRLSEFTEEEKQARRKLKNRVAAQSARDKKRKLNQDQHDELIAAKQEIATLKQEIWQLRQENASLRQENIQYRHEKLSLAQTSQTSPPLTIATESLPPRKEDMSHIAKLESAQVQIVAPDQGGVPLKTEFAPSAERPQSSFRAGTHPPSSPTAASASSRPSSARGKGSSTTTPPAALSPPELSAFCMLLVQVLLTKAGLILGQLDDKPEKQLRRRILYANQMKSQGQSPMPRHTFTTQIAPLSPSRKLLVEVPTTANRKRKLPPLEELSPSPAKTLSPPETTTSTTSSAPSSTRSRKTSSSEATSNQQTLSSRILSSRRSTPSSGSTPRSWPTSSPTWAPSSGSGTGPRTPSSRAPCPAHPSPDKSCLVCRQPLKQPCRLPAALLNQLNATDFILRQFHINRESQIMAQQKQAKMALLRQALKARLERTPSDPRNLAIVAALRSNCDQRLLRVAAEVSRSRNSSASASR